MWASLRPATWDSVGAGAGSVIGLSAAGAVAWSFGEFFQVYHFTLVLAFIGAGMATSIAIRRTRRDCIAKTRMIAGSAALGFLCGLVGGVLANELAGALFRRELAIAAWSMTGAMLGLTLSAWFEDRELLPASCGGLFAGMVAGWLLFDPFASLFQVMIEAAGFGFSFRIAVTVADSVLGSGGLLDASSGRNGGWR
jgi:hypothetical protein